MIVSECLANSFHHTTGTPNNAPHYSGPPVRSPSLEREAKDGGGPLLRWMRCTFAYGTKANFNKKRRNTSSVTLRRQLPLIKRGSLSSLPREGGKGARPLRTRAENTTKSPRKMRQKTCAEMPEKYGKFAFKTCTNSYKFFCEICIYRYFYVKKSFF